jgi:cytochrome c biogenesis protein CcmG/thiol:disulfide interchange protein DsbE
VRALVLGVSTTIALMAPCAASAAAKVGKPAPGFSLTTLDHKKYSLADLKGKVVVLNYWATWCAPCRGEMVVMENYMRHHPDTDLKIFAIDTMEKENFSEAQFKPLAAHLSFPLVFTMWGWGYGALGGAVPTSYVIDRAGVVRYAAAGAFDDGSFAATVSPLLAEPAPADAVPKAVASAN